MKIYPENLALELDFPQVLNRIQMGCSTPMAKELARSVVPILDGEEVRQKLRQVNELLQLLEADEHLPSSIFESIAPQTKRLKTKGASLEAPLLGLIRSALLTYKAQYEFVDRRREKLPEMGLLFFRLPYDAHPAQLIDAILDERDQVKNSASNELAKIRADLSKSRAAADRIFERMVKKYQSKGYLVDFNESVSENRRVLAIQSSYKGQVSGIFHGSSAKHSVTYLEPAEAVEVNNQVAYLLEAERQEIIRILRELCGKLRPYVSYFADVEEIMVYYDYTKARALYAKREESCMPKVVDEGDTILLKAYNPVLKQLNRERAKPTIPLDLSLHAQQRIVVISGPNAGGKSIALKTLGLLQMMVQSGFLVPVDPNSQFRIFDALMGDIGDSQSLENELSTYSSKLQKMRYFLEWGDEHSLLLIDEFGSGSDPQLGSSLAQVFLKKLNGFGVSGIFTTHFNAIKALAADEPSVVNAAMLFDKKTFEPTYQLELGNPGSSYTFEVAQRTGIPKGLIEEARALTDESTLEVDKLLVQIQADKLSLERTKSKLGHELGNLRKLEREQQETIQKLQEKLEKQSRLNSENDRLLYWGQRFQKLVESWLAQSSQKEKKAVVARFIGMLNQRAGEVQTEESEKNRKEAKAQSKRLAKLLELPLKVGDQVQLLDNKMKGSILEIKGDRYKVSFGGTMSSTLSREQIIPVENRPKGKSKPKQKSATGSKDKSASKQKRS